MSLVAEYGSSPEPDAGVNKEPNGESVLENNGDGSSERNSIQKLKEMTNETGKVNENKPVVKLPSATSVIAKISTTSVLSNEFKKEEDDKTKVLEQHVKMVKNLKSTTVNGKVNGKKVCWMYRRGRCRLGKKCQMYHDSELQSTDGTLKKPQESASSAAQSNSMPSKRPCEDSSTTNEENEGPKNKIVKKRFGLSDDIVPSKKVIKHYETISAKEAKAAQ